MLNWLNLKSGRIGNAVKEEIVGDMTGDDLRQTQDEMWRLDSEMRAMLDGLTVDQRQALNDSIRAQCQQWKMDNLAAANQ